MAKFIVNKGGAVHSVNDDHVFYEENRPATAQEIADWHQAQGLDVPEEYAPVAESAAAHELEKGQK